MAGPLLAQEQIRCSSYSPLSVETINRKKVTINTLRSMHKKKDPITMITAHDFPSGYVADAAGMDMVLVGDSLAMVALGMQDTSEILVEEMILHCKSVARATKGAFTVSYSNARPLALHADIVRFPGWRPPNGLLRDLSDSSSYDSHSIHQRGPHAIHQA